MTAFLPESMLAIGAPVLGPFAWFDIALIVVILILGVMVWVLTRHQECHYDGEPEGSIIQMLPAVAGSTHGYPVPGNRVELVQNENYFDVACEMIGQAKASVHLETYMWKDGMAADRIADALCTVARSGVTVRVLTDARGSSKINPDTVARLRDCGCEFAKFHRWQLSNLGRFNVRDHRKLIVVDGAEALIGGHCVTDRWLIDEAEKPRYRDISAKVSGPVVAQLQSAFLENWQEVTGDLFVDATTFPAIQPTGDMTAHLAYVRADGCPSSVQVLHYLAIGFAKQRIRIQNPYFIPDSQGVKALVRAVARGVDVQIMTPSVDATDTPYVQRASHFVFGKLLKGGVKIFEYQPTLIHQKCIVVDGEWCALGSSNFDDRSFEINDEITLGIADASVAGQLEAAFDADLKQCRERSWDEWQSRALWKRAVDGMFYLFNEQL